VAAAAFRFRLIIHPVGAAEHGDGAKTAMTATKTKARPTTSLGAYCAAKPLAAARSSVLTIAEKV
jgi:hypothetical protein